MEANTTNTDAMGSMKYLCHVSSSQEEYLLHCPFAFDNAVSADSGNRDGDGDSLSENEIDVASTGIMIVSPPETPEFSQNDDRVPPKDDDDDNNNNDTFHTPPEERSPSSSQQTQCNTVRVQDDAAELTETIEIVSDSDEREAIDSCYVKARVSKRGLGFNVGPCESPNKKSKVSEEGLRVEVKSNKIVKSPLNREVEIGFDEEVCRLCDADEERLVRKSNDDIDRFRHDKASGKTEGVGGGKRMLPASMCGNKESAVAGEAMHDGGGSGDSDQEKHEEITLLDVLKMLAERCETDPSAEGLSLVEIAKKRGMTFP